MSLAARALVALALMVGFYALAIIIAVVLLYLPYAEVVYAHRLHPKLAIVCIVGAGVILWSIVPRPDRFLPPGPRLETAAHPRLFQRLTAVAQAVGQPMPAEVYLAPEVNAWVAQRGGWMGFGSRRVMGGGCRFFRSWPSPRSKRFWLMNSATIPRATPAWPRGSTRREAPSSARCKVCPGTANS